ncbi:MAG: ornithine--oxo-acid transaminase [Deltaproteobacteria bacterium]|nr:ornithine--oxo-acid transaminase [Deltaproteobacteria bacterium]
MATRSYLELEEAHGARNYKPLPVVLTRGEGVWVWDVDGRKYLDMLSAYSAVSHGHRHPRLLDAARRQLDRLTLTSRAFHNDQLGPLCRDLAALCGMELVLPMNTGAEAVETAIKAARRWGYRVKKVPPDSARIIVCDHNFHGRTTTIVSFSTDSSYRDGFGPFTPGFDLVPFDDADAMSAKVGPNTVAVLMEPIQGEAGVVVPRSGYLRRVRDLCTRHGILMLADEVQTGLGRTGRTFACDHEDVRPDAYILGKALGGGIVPISAVVADRSLLGVFDPGSHGSTFGGNPLAAAVAREALRILEEEHLAERADRLGAAFRKRLESLVGKGRVAGVRGRGLLNAVVLDPAPGGARVVAEQLMERGLLCKETHDHVLRFAPPLVLTEDEQEFALQILIDVLG